MIIGVEPDECPKISSKNFLEKYNMEYQSKINKINDFIRNNFNDTGFESLNIKKLLNVINNIYLVEKKDRLFRIEELNKKEKILTGELSAACFEAGMRLAATVQDKIILMIFDDISWKYNDCV